MAFDKYYVGATGNIARPFFFELRGGPFDDMRYYIRTASLPSVTISSVNVNYKGIEWKVPGTPTFNDLSATILCMDDFKQFKSIHSKLKETCGWGPGGVTYKPVIGDITLKGGDGNGVSYKLENSFISSIGDLSFDQDNKDSILTFDCTVIYSIANTSQ